MGTDIANQTTTGRPLILAAAAKERINTTFNRLVDMGGRSEIAEVHAPSKTEIVALRGRLGEIARCMEPCETLKIRTMVGGLLAGYPSGRAHREDPDAVLKMFVQALRDLPEWSVGAACSAWNRGEAKGKNTSFAPSPSDLRAVALDQTEEFDRERHKIKAILGADVVPEQESDEKRAEVAARVKQWVKDREPNNEATRKLSEDEFEAFSARFKGDLRMNPPHLSSAAKYAAGLIPAMQERREQQDQPAEADYQEQGYEVDHG